MELDIEIMVTIPDTSSKAPDEKYNGAQFNYDEITDT